DSLGGQGKRHATGGLVQSHNGVSQMMGLLDFRPTATVVMASAGYPGSYEKGAVIKGVEAAGDIDGVSVFQAGCGVNGSGELIAEGGRVLGVTATGESLRQAVDRAYQGVDCIDWSTGFFRKDIGWRAL
ncbi:MAG: phosphoribosylglycinamide synthetase C domain-containing protein, partial [Henriciella sp.]